MRRAPGEVRQPYNEYYTELKEQYEGIPFLSLRHETEVTAPGNPFAQLIHLKQRIEQS